jgi:hypothetical protein
MRTVGAGTPSRVAACLAWITGLGFGPLGLYGTVYFVRHGEVWYLMGFPTYGDGPFEVIGVTTTVGLLTGFVTVCAAELAVGALLWKRRGPACCSHSRFSHSRRRTGSGSPSHSGHSSEPHGPWPSWPRYEAPVLQHRCLKRRHDGVGPPVARWLSLPETLLVNAEPPPSRERAPARTWTSGTL